MLIAYWGTTLIYTENVPDRDEDGIAPLNANVIDYGDLRPGDIVFFDWDAPLDYAQHTLVLESVSDNNATSSFGNFRGDEEWSQRDLQPIANVSDLENYLNHHLAEPGELIEK